MSNTTLSEIIDTMVIEKTISLDAIDKVKALKDRAADQDNQLKSLRSQLDDSKRDVAIQSGQIREFKGQIEVFQKREAELVERERKIFEHEKKTAVAEAVAGTMRDMVGTVFRNTVIREGIQRSIPHTFMPPGSHYPQTAMMQGHDSIERHAE